MYKQSIKSSRFFISGIGRALVFALAFGISDAGALVVNVVAPAPGPDPVLGGGFSVTSNTPVPFPTGVGVMSAGFFGLLAGDFPGIAFVNGGVRAGNINVTTYDAVNDGMFGGVYIEANYGGGGALPAMLSLFTGQMWNERRKVGASRPEEYLQMISFSKILPKEPWRTEYGGADFCI